MNKLYFGLKVINRKLTITNFDENKNNIPKDAKIFSLNNPHSLANELIIWLSEETDMVGAELKDTVVIFMMKLAVSMVMVLKELK